MYKESCSILTHLVKTRPTSWADNMCIGARIFLSAVAVVMALVPLASFVQASENGIGNQPAVHPKRPGITNPPTAHAARVIPSPPKIPPPAPGRGPVPASILAWDAPEKTVTLQRGITNAHFTFYVTNVSPSPVLVTDVRTACGCATAKLPEQPWVVQPGNAGPIHVDLNVAEIQGLAMKGILVDTSAGFKYLIVKANMLPPGPSPSLPLTNASSGLPKLPRSR